MSITEILILIQTIILLFTGLIVLWYTFETNKIRKETNKQNSIYAEQSILLQKNQEIESKKFNSFIEPLIIRTGGQYNNEKAECNFTNNCGSITNIKVVSLANFNADIYFDDILRTGEICKIIFSGYPNPYPEKLSFEIHYENKIGKKGAKNFHYYLTRANLSKI